MTQMLHRLEYGVRATLPVLMTTGLVILGGVDFGLPHFGAIAAPLTLVAIYYWSLFRPDLLPYSMVFLLGILQDILHGAPLGLNALVMVLVSLIIRNQARFLTSQGFVVQWLGFLMVVFADAMLQWFLHSMHAGQILAISHGLLRALLGAAIYPFLDRFILLPVHRATATS